MALRIRLRRMGRKKAPTYRIVVAEATMPRDGRFVATIGHYNPRTDPLTLVVKQEEARKWLAHGAQPTETVHALFKRAGVYKPPSAVETVVETVSGAASRAASTVAGAASTAASAVADTASTAASAVADAASTAAGAVGEVVGDAVDTARDAAEAVVERVRGEAEESAEAVTEAAPPVEETPAAVVAEPAPEPEAAVETEPVADAEETRPQA